MIVFDTVADEIYTKVEPLAYADASSGYPLKEFVTAEASLLQELDDYVREGPDGEAGWSSLVDLNRAPTKGLPWLGQFAGVTVPGRVAGQTDEQYDAAARGSIASLSSQKRGRPLSIIAAAQQYLTGNKSVILRERDGGAYKLTLVTFTAETPNPAAVLAAVLATQKPGGITLTYNVIAGQDYQILFGGHADYQNVFTTYATYQGVLNDAPGT